MVMQKTKVMSNMNNIYTRILAFGLALVAAFMLSSCSDFDLDGPTIDNDMALVTISMDVPGSALSGTRAMDNNAEASVDLDKMQAVIFMQTDAGNEVFKEKAILETKGLNQVALRMNVDKSKSKYRIVLFANTGEYNTPIAGKTPKVEVLKQFAFANKGKWSTDKSIPMWGESMLMEIEANKNISIPLNRALARVDVGLRFKFNDDSFSGPVNPNNEETQGLESFTIHDVRVYRTRNSGYVSSLFQLKEPGDEVKYPSIPEGAKYNSGNSQNGHTSLEEADKDPLIYTLGSGESSSIREIYIPEAEGFNADDAPCIVVGGYYGKNNASNITYYRADFPERTNLDNSNFIPVLRNHRYVFDIKKVDGPGYEKPEEALKGIKSPMEVEVLEWNEVRLDYYVQGEYYMKVSEREIWMDATPQNGSDKVFYEVPYETNLELSDFNSGNANPDLRKDFVLTWKKGDKSPFNVEVDYVKKKFIFSASKNFGNGSETRDDTLQVAVENFSFDIKVNQKASFIKYDLECGSVNVHGNYREGVELNYTNYITLNVNTLGDMAGKEYEIKTIEKNGIYFYAKGVLTAATQQEIKLEGHGTLVNNSGHNFLRSFDVKIVSNTFDGNAECDKTRIVVGYKSKKILTIGANAGYRFGYQLEPNTASRAFVDASINFGTYPNSKVVMESSEKSGHAFDIKMLTLGQGMTGEWINHEALVDALSDFKPDIILTGQAIDYFEPGTDNGSKNIDLISSFVDAGGVFLMCNEYYPFASSIDAMVGKIMGSVDGKILSIGFEQLFAMQGSDDDMIVNGPFGDMNGKNWGADGHILHGYTGLPQGTVTYSSKDGSAVMFRHPTKPFFFMGEGGFISNPQRFIGAHYRGSNVYCPFSIDKNYSAIPRTNYTSNNNETVYNSQIFGNILAWAVDQSENNPVKYPL